MSSLECQSEVKKLGGLGTFTKCSPKLDTQGFQRVHDFILQDQSAKLLPKERVRFCLKNRISKLKNRTVMLHESANKMYWGNVQRCGSIWNCPVCAKKITEQRRDELKRGLDVWLKRGNYCYMITLTNSHSASSVLDDLKLSQRKAVNRFFKGRKADSLMLRLGKVHHVKAYEVTYGQNGWHPHHHILIFSNRYLGISEFCALENDLKEHWINCCRLSNLLLPSMKYGLTLCDGSYAAEYVGKWGLEHELTKGHVKKGRKESLTPFDLLRLSFDDVEVFGKLPSKLFQEFAIVFKGARQLFWTRGAKKDLGIIEKDDQQIVDETTEESIEVFDVDVLMFYLLNKYQKRHVFLDCLLDDWNNGSFGSGTAQQLISDLIDIEESNFENLDDSYFINILRLMA